MNLTIYLPDKFGERVKRKMRGLSISLVCRKALDSAMRRIDRENGQAKKRASA